MLNIIREKAPHKKLFVDANCGWTPANVVERCRFVSRYKLELIEQPMPPGEHAGLAEVRAELREPIMADESCVGVDDVLKCVGHFDGVNIKLSKCGGMRRALQMIHTARSAGMKVMLGCMVETSVGISLAANLAPLVDFIDLDGHMLLADDPFEGLGGTNGALTLNDRPGLGIVERK
jgi:L-alanine-DL-glutamate epimerase-like enolase superfamily enzyme